MRTIYLVDISAYVFRAYYAIRPLSTATGIPTNATYGVVTMLLKFLREVRPGHLIIVFDSPTPSFRKQLYTAYKANREVPPEDLPPQFEQVKEFVRAYPLQGLECEGYEADDIMATIATECRDDKIVLVSSDKDLMQLIDDRVTMYDPMKDVHLGISEVAEKFAVLPSQVIDVQSLAGDASDNIPGVKGVGVKTAGKLIQEWGGLDNLYAHVAEISGKLGERLREDRGSAFLSRQLVTLKRDVPVHIDPEQFKVGPANQDALRAFYRKLEFQKLLTDTLLTEVDAVVASSRSRNYQLVLSPDQLGELVMRLRSAPDGFAFDTETTGLNPWDDRLVGLSFSTQDGEGYYVPVGHLTLEGVEQLPRTQVLKAVGPLLEDADLPKWAQNAKFDCEVLAQVGISVRGIRGDAMLASYMLKPDGAHNMDALAKEYLNVDTIKYQDVVAKGQDFSSVELREACAYAAEDADITLQLNQCLHGLLNRDDRLRHCYETIELHLIPVLVAMELHGVFVNRSGLQVLAKEFAERLVGLELKIHHEAGGPFNVQSPKQLAEILFERLKLPPQKKTKTGYSTDVEVLQALAERHPICGHLLEYRLLAKLKSTYVDQLSQLMSRKTGRIHTSYHQAGTATGRLSSSDPNLQNIPIRTAEGRRIRATFEAPSGWQILSADYSQIELRLLAALSGDRALVGAFVEGRDVHGMTADKIFGGVTEASRARAKTINFGILYGQSAFGLSNQLDIPPKEAQQYIDDFYRTYPGVQEYKERVLAEARRVGEVRTWQGRRRLVPELNSQNKMIRANAERFAFNTVFQGSAADLIKVAMIKIHEALQQKGFETKMIMQVHDELVFEVPNAELDLVKPLVKDLMEHALPCAVPLNVDIGVGDNWDAAH